MNDAIYKQVSSCDVNVRFIQSLFYCSTIFWFFYICVFFYVIWLWLFFFPSCLCVCYWCVFNLVCLSCFIAHSILFTFFEWSVILQLYHWLFSWCFGPFGIVIFIHVIKKCLFMRKIGSSNVNLGKEREAFKLTSSFEI